MIRISSMKPMTKMLQSALLAAALVPLTFAFGSDAPKAPDTPAPAGTPLHEVGSGPAAPSAQAAQGTAGDAGSDDRDLGVGDDHGNRFTLGASTRVSAGETLEGNAVSVCGPLTVDGEVHGNAVAVMASGTINGTVHGNAVVVLGTLRLGPKARVLGNVVDVAGRVDRDPGAFVGGNVVQQGLAVDTSDDSEAVTWFHHALRLGRPLAIHEHLHLLWLLTLAQVALYVVLAFAFPGGVRACGEALTQRTGATLLTGVLATLAVVPLFVLLCVTIVGIPVALVVLPLLLAAGMIFGKVSIYSLVGRAIVGRQTHLALAVLAGTAVFIALYLVPAVGITVWIVVGFLGLASALTALIASSRAPAPLAAAPAGPAQEPPAQPPVQTPPPPPAVLHEPGAPPVLPAQAPSAPLLSPQPQAPGAHPAQPPESSHPRAGFGIRMAALLIDIILVSIIVRVDHLIPLALAVYGAILWKLKGSTVGGIIFGLKVVKLHGGPVDWVTAIVRALGCFLSLFVIGLGFLWIVFDPEKQSWHDKIAGTVVVRPPKASSLV
jgi:uncharacterized RDD family membrane protein YckC/cytoskeletal protein CcmA (bactofilin family)